jgi:hypothetical protein
MAVLSISLFVLLAKSRMVAYKIWILSIHEDL